ncbi:peptidoglycan DD-metalloendopeptidase family protein [Endozoicomonas numazuensis]|uniref:peptidoglycan DD-metalloendopeptidase family protein n=1 Tax=Endozoicomonas numazuensis TaxID=1137799 RepID=UPI00068B3548|nr:peptidoglycan DD-metalloendopeptidase family protein [Endozoicomonas numazuensis]
MPANQFLRACSRLFDRHQRSSSQPFNFKIRGILPLVLIASVPFSGLSVANTSEQNEPGAFEFHAPLFESDLEAPEQDPLQSFIEQKAGQEIWREYTPSGNDNIWTFFQNQSLSELDLIELLKVDKAEAYLASLESVVNIRYQLYRNNRLARLSLTMKSGEIVLLQKNEDSLFNLSINSGDHLPEFKTFTGEIQGSLYQSARKAGVSVSAILQFATIFQWQIDFNKDLRAGDRFELLIDDSLKNSQGFDGNILAARLYQKDEVHTAVRYSDSQYYTPQGKMLSSSFSRYPLGKESRVSSGFNPARKHPITGQVRPHRGTDWAVPVGTAVYAPADGVIVKAQKNHPAAGTFIEMRNGRRFVTRYLHLSQLDVKEGQQVRKGDTIGRTGNTGLSTGPHLHFELFVDGKAVDVMTARLPTGESLQGDALKRFKIATQPLISAMNRDQQETLLASKETGTLKN